MKIYKPNAMLFLATTLLTQLAVASSAIARSDELPRGTIIDRVVCEADLAQSYALYLPSGYTPQKKWPIIYAFDPGARGRLPVRLYREAAEKYGYIVAGSYNSQNGMQNAPLQASISAIITDTRKRLSIDDMRIYTTGFSGGARVATRVASSCRGCIAGVIACGAGFPSDIAPTSATSFVFYGTVGFEDFNYPELIRLEDKLDSLKIPNHIETFEGEHQWATSLMFIEAVEWIEIQAMRAGRRNLDNALLEAVWKKRLDGAKTVEATGNIYNTYLAYQALANDFRNLKNVVDYDKKTATLVESKEFKLGVKKEQDQLREQQAIAHQLIDLGSKLVTERSQSAAQMKEFKLAVKGFQKKAHSADSSESRVVRRALLQVSAQTFEAALYNYLPSRQTGLAIVNLLVAEEVTPDLPRITFELARALALNGEKKMALETLRRAVDKGWTDADIIETHKDFDNIRKDTEFKLIIDGLRKGKSQADHFPDFGLPFSSFCFRSGFGSERASSTGTTRLNLKINFLNWPKT